MQKRMFAFAIAAALAISCAVTPSVGGKFRAGSIPDGVYEGVFYSWPNKAWVRVTLEDGRITECKVYKTTGVFRATGVEIIIPWRIVKNQSTEVDVVSGASNFSNVVMNAAEDALRKASE